MSETVKKKNTRKTGDLGEKIAQKYLIEQGFTVIETNYRKNWGELDIIAKKSEVIHFVEVKTHKYDSKSELEKTQSGEAWQPEELVDDRKLHQIEKAFETWLSERKWEGEYQVDVAAVKMVPNERYATVKYFKNITKV